MEQPALPILLACLSYASEAAKAERLTHVSAGQWRMVAELAQQHGVAVLLYHNLKPLGLALPNEVAEELKQKYRQNALRNFRLYQWLGELLRLLQAKNIAVIVLKGAYLAEAVYDNIGLRTMGDLDLLVKKDDLLRVEEELLALGCKPEEYSRVITRDDHHFPYKLPGSSLPVEIHWAILDSSYSSHIDMDGLWSRAQPATLAQSPALALSPEYLLLYLCIHIAMHVSDMRIRMLCDIGQVVRRFGAELDWEEMGTCTRQGGKVRAVYVALRLAQELLGVAVPVEWLASLRSDRTDERYFDLAREQILATRVDGDMLQSENVARMWALKGFGSKLALAGDCLFPSRETMALKYPAPANSWRIYLYYPARIKYVLMWHGATLWRLARGDPKTRVAAERTNQITALRDWLMAD